MERRLRFALTRFGGRVGRVKVRISDVNGPRGGIDKCCRICAEIVPFDTVVLEEVDAELHAAIDRAADRLGGSFARRLKRARELRVGRESIRAQSDRREFLL